MSSTIRSQLFRALDIETTGLDPKTDAIVELAWAIMRGDGAVLSSGSTLINPGRPIPTDAFRKRKRLNRRLVLTGGDDGDVSFPHGRPRCYS